MQLVDGRTYARTHELEHEHYLASQPMQTKNKIALVTRGLHKNTRSDFVAAEQ